MDLLEFQGKSLFARVGVPVPEGRVAATPAEARRAAEELGGRVVVKAQVRIGGRGKAGGIQAAETPGEAEAAAGAILGMDLRGHRVGLVWVERATEIAAEWYASFMLDRGVGKHLAMVSARGGMDIEAVAASEPAAVVRRQVDPVVGLAPWEASDLVYRAGLDRGAARAAAATLRRLYRAFVDLDCDLVEVNPLVLTAAGEVVALDAKVSLDSNAFFRHPDFESFREAFAEDPLERLAREKGLGFIKLDGSVGIVGNGAGLVMSTLDVVSLVGGAAANFLDVGGGASAQTISDALEVLTRDAAVRAVLVNIFGGITRCDLVAEGIVAALGSRELPWPIVVRLDGTNAPEGRAILARAASEKVIPAATMLEAAQRAVELAGEALMAVYVDETTRLLVQNLTGREGSFHAMRNRAYGTQVVAGVSPGKGGADVQGVPVFDTVAQAVEAAGANTTLCLVPAPFAPDAILEAAAAPGMRLIVAITEGIPAQDEARVVNYLRQTTRVPLIGPNCPGVISPGKANVGIMPHEICLAGDVGVVSRSGTLTYQAIHELTTRGIGQSTCVGIGGDPVPGTSFVDVLERFQADPQTRAVVLIGEIGGEAEEQAADYIRAHMTKPVVAYIAGFTAPPGKKMGHAGAIISGSSGTAAGKKEALEAAGATVVTYPTQIGEAVAALR